MKQGISIKDFEELAEALNNQGDSRIMDLLDKLRIHKFPHPKWVRELKRRSELLRNL